MQTLYRDFLKQVSRRDFLKLCGLGLAAVIPVPCLRSIVTKRGFLEGESTTPEYGRVLRYDINLYEKPSLLSKKGKKLERDQVVKINSALLGDSNPSYNRIWYEVESSGYVHSGGIQPVGIQLNPAFRNIPADGTLAEVTVPYTDTLLEPDRLREKSYRLYYGTTYWVHKVHEIKPGSVWYEIRDDRLGKIYFANATHLHLVQSQDIAPIAIDVPDELKRIEVMLDTQVMVAYEDEQPVFMSRIASGAVFYDGDFSTPTGTFITDRKRPTRHMTAEDGAGYTSYDLPGVPWVTYINRLGVSFHGTYWHNDFGRPRSHGCLNLSNEAARWVYRWTYPFVPLENRYFEGETGTRVDILSSKVV